MHVQLTVHFSLSYRFYDICFCLFFSARVGISLWRHSFWPVYLFMIIYEKFVNMILYKLLAPKFTARVQFWTDMKLVKRSKVKVTQTRPEWSNRQCDVSSKSCPFPRKIGFYREHQNRCYLTVIFHSIKTVLYNCDCDYYFYY